MNFKGQSWLHLYEEEPQRGLRHRQSPVQDTGRTRLKITKKLKKASISFRSDMADPVICSLFITYVQ